MAVFEPLGTHQFDETKSSFATVAAYGSGPPRPCRQWVFYCILVSGAACTALRSQFACEHKAMRRAWRG